MNAKDTIKEILGSIPSGNSNLAMLPRLGLPDVLQSPRVVLDLFSFNKCVRFKKQLQAHGVQFDHTHQISKICRINQLTQYCGHLTLKLAMPVYSKPCGTRQSSVAFKVSIPKNEMTERLAVDQFVWIDPKSICDFEYPRPEFKLGSWQVLSDIQIGKYGINPFDYASPAGMDKWVYSSRSEQRISTQELVSILAALFEFMNIADQSLLRLMLLTQDRLDRFINAPASTSSHHQYKHGLLEHTVEVCLQALLLVKQSNEWSKVDVSQLILQSILHDFGKLDEYEQMGPDVYALSTSGILLGHQVKAALWAHQAALQIGNYCTERLMQLIHGLTAVNRDCQQSGNRSRKTPESIITNQADRLSASINSRLGGSWLLNNQFCVGA